LHTARNEGAEARFIVDTMARLVDEGTDISDIAVLFRSGYHSYKLEMELTSRYIDFEKRGGLKLTESAHIKDVLSFFRVLVNPLDNLSWNRILLQLDKVGPKTAQKILAFLKNSDDPITALGSYQPGRTWREGFIKLTELMGNLQRPGLTPAGQFDLVMEYYEPVLEKIYYDDYPKRKKDVDQLKSIVAGYGDLQSLIDDTTLDPPEAGQELPGSPDGEPGKLVLSTIHSAKGLEWDTVFVIGLAEGRFPHQNTMPGEQWEEERRLLYVAATRAKKNLYLTYPQELISPDRQVMRSVMSPFLREINPGLYSRESGSPTPSAGGFGFSTPPSRPTAARAPSKTRTAELMAGMLVRHPFFGRGQVKDIPGPRRVEVSFDRHGDKILHLDYAKLEIIA
ncbi:MAG TPA: ATP-dependent helicase, partial [Desulfobacteraceae bacterium]|nr:ATP-dependent helicase [Desulfobacteraceae bacterium]